MEFIAEGVKTRNEVVYSLRPMGSSRRAAMYRNVSIRIPLRPQIAVSEFI
jgi:hypothetical protein